MKYTILEVSTLYNEYDGTEVFDTMVGLEMVAWFMHARDRETTLESVTADISAMRVGDAKSFGRYIIVAVQEEA